MVLMNGASCLVLPPPLPMPCPPGVRSSLGLVVLLLLALSGARDVAVGQSTSALVSQVRGDVKVRKGGEGAELPAKVGLRLVEGDALEVARGSRVVLLFNNGRLVTATTPLVLAAVGGAGAAEIYERAARTLAAADSQARPARGGGIGRPPPAGAYPLRPAFGALVASPRPTFAWRPQEGADEYLIQLRSLDGGTAPLRFRVSGTGPWALPDSVPPLARGGRYAWAVVPLPGGRMAGEEQFGVLDQDGADELTALGAALETAGVDPEADGLLVRAMVYADLGLLHEAEDALARLVEVTPEELRDPTVDLLHARVLEGLGRIDEAAAAFDRAQRGGG